MEKRVTIRYRQSVTEELKLRVLRELLDTGSSVASVADKFNVGVSSVYLWMSTFGVELPKEKEFSCMDQEKEALLKEIAELKRSLKKQELRAWEAEVDALAHKRLLEHIAKKYHIDVKRKTDSQ